RKWQDAQSEESALYEKIKKCNEEIEAHLNKCSELFNKYHLDRVDDASKAQSVLRKLRDQERQRTDLKNEVSRCTERIDKQKEIQSQKKTALEAIYERLNIDFGKKEEVYRLLDQLESYDTVKKEYQLAEGRLADKQKEMESHSLFEVKKEEIE